MAKISFIHLTTGRGNPVAVAVNHITHIRKDTPMYPGDNKCTISTADGSAYTVEQSYEEVLNLLS